MGTLILSKRMIVPLFMPFAFIGLMSIFFGGLIFFIDSHFNPIRIGAPLVIGTVSLAIATAVLLQQPARPIPQQEKACAAKVFHFPPAPRC